MISTPVTPTHYTDTSVKPESSRPPGVVLTAEQMNALQYTSTGMYSRGSDPGWEAKRDAGLGITPQSNTPAVTCTTKVEHSDSGFVSITKSYESQPVEAVKKDRTAGDFLQIAQSILEQRGKQYDKPKGERSMAATVAAFNAITGQSLTEPHGWLLLTLLKLVRDNQREAPHEDSCMDLVTYSSLYAEARMKA